jgi:aminoglycoside phosphotransferase (APT) family kinase protein
MNASGPSPALLHLDLHPFNVLLDEAETPTVIDWANAASGPAELDLARTATMMTFDPAARAHTGDPRWNALMEGWSQESGWDEIHDPVLVWALRFMVRDLSRRYSQAQLAPIAARLAELDAT